VDRASLPWWPSGGHPDVVWLPFFRVEISVARAGKRLPGLGALLREVMPAAGPHSPPLPAELTSCWIPAFDVLTVSRYDAWAFEWGEALTRTAPECGERRFFIEEPVAKANRVLLPSVKWETLRPLLPRLLPGLLPKPLQTRLNPVVLKSLLASTLEASKARLVFVPAPVTVEGDRRVLGPTSSVSWVPLRDGKWPPDLERDVRRAMDRGKRMEKPASEGGVIVSVDWKATLS
jgi:hypothetical protein